MVCCPSEMTPRMGTGTASLTSPSKVARSPRVLLSKVRASSTSPDKQSRIIQSTSWPTSGCIPSMASSTWPCCLRGQMIQLTRRIATAPHHQGEADQPPERHQCALGVVRHPQPFSTVHALFGERDQSDFSLCRGTGFSSSHVLAPPSGNSSATFLRKKFRSSLSVERTSSTISGDTRLVSPIHLKNFLNEDR